MNKLTKPSATTGSALAEANAYIEAISKAMNALLRDPPELSIDEARTMLVADGFSEVPILQFAAIQAQETTE